MFFSRKIESVFSSQVQHLHNWTWDEKPIDILAMRRRKKWISCAYVFHLFIYQGGPSQFSVCGLGGICTEDQYRHRGYAKEVVRAAMDKYRFKCHGYLLNGRPGSQLWLDLGFKDIGQSPTRKSQRLWWQPSQIATFEDFTILPKGFHF